MGEQDEVLALSDEALVCFVDFIRRNHYSYTREPALIRRVFAAYVKTDVAALCHCGDPVAYGYDGDPEHHRGMCEHCDAVRCDAHPGECKRAHSPDPAADPTKEGES